MDAARPFSIERPTCGGGVRLIALTPLIDMVFILLIFFMLASSFIEWRALGLSHADPESGDRPAILVVGPEGSLSLDGRTIAAESLEAELRGRAKAGIVVVPYPDLPLSRLVPVLDAAAAAGARRIALSSGRAP